MESGPEAQASGSTLEAGTVSRLIEEANRQIVSGGHLRSGNSQRIALLIRTALAGGKVDAIQRELLLTLLHRLEDRFF